MLVRPRSTQDLAACVAVLARVQAATGYPARWPNDPELWLTPDDSCAWVAVVGGDVAGHVCLAPGTGPVAAVSRLYVAPARQGQGIAAALLATVLAHGSREGLQIQLDGVEDGGRAVGLYEHLGWRLVERRPAGWVMPDGRRLMERVYLAPEPSPGSPGGTAAATHPR